MENNRFAVFCQLDIQLDAITVRPCAMKCRKGIFRDTPVIVVVTAVGKWSFFKLSGIPAAAGMHQKQRNHQYKQDYNR